MKVKTNKEKGKKAELLGIPGTKKLKIRKILPLETKIRETEKTVRIKIDENPDINGLYRIEDINSFIRQNYLSNFQTSKYIITRIIPQLPEREQIRNLPYLTALIYDDDMGISHSAMRGWKKISPTKLLEKFSKEEKIEIADYIKGNYKNSDPQIRKSIAPLLEVSINAIDPTQITYLLMLAKDPVEEIRETGIWFYNRINKNNLFDGLSKEELKPIMEFIEENYNSMDDIKREVAGELIGLLPRKYVVNFLPYLAILSADQNLRIQYKCTEIWNTLAPEDWVNELEKKNLKPLMRFIEDNYNSMDAHIRWSVGKIIGLLPRKYAIRYLHYLAILKNSFSGSWTSAFSAWEALKPWEWIGSVPEKMMKNLLDFIEENCNSNNPTLRMAALDLIEIFPLKLQSKYFIILNILRYDESPVVRKKAKNILNELDRNREDVHIKRWTTEGILRMVNSIVRSNNNEKL